MLKATWEITRRCNADCAHCYVEGSKDLGELPPRAIDQVLESLFDGGVRFLTFAGGEPCVARHFEHALAQALEIGFHTKVITNGTVFRRRLVESVDAGEVDAVVSVLAGTGEAFERAFGIDARHFAKQSDLMGMLREFSVNVALFSKNADRDTVLGISRHLSRFRGKIRDVSVFRAMPIGRGAMDARREPGDDYGLLSGHLLQGLREAGIDAELGVDCADQGECPLVGAPAPGGIYVDPTGRVRACHALAGFETKESLLDVGLASLLSSPALQRWSGSNPALAFDRRCKKAMLDAGFDRHYVDDGGGASALVNTSISTAPDLVLEEYDGSWYGYRQSEPVMLEFNADAYALLHAVAEGSQAPMLADLDREELASALSVLAEAEQLGLLTIDRPAILQGARPKAGARTQEAWTGIAESRGKEDR